MSVNLYSTNCPRCDVLEKKLAAKELDFSVITDFDKREMMKRGFATAPVLEVDGEFMDFTVAVNWINSL